MGIPWALSSHLLSAWKGSKGNSLETRDLGAQSLSPQSHKPPEEGWRRAPVAIHGLCHRAKGSIHPGPHRGVLAASGSSQPVTVSGF